VKTQHRVALIKRIGKRLATESWTDIDLTLRQFGLPWSPTWEGGQDRYAYCIQHIERGNDAALLALGDYLFGTSDDEASSTRNELPWQANRFRLFLSHISAAKTLASDAKTALATRAIDGFVAHEDIEPTKEWVVQIELALETCDALAAILTDGFHESKWTDQEIGFCVNRRILIIPVRLGVTPYGFISRYQALTPSIKDATVVADRLFEILCKHDLTAEKMSAALVAQFADSDSFASAKANAKLLQRVRAWTPERLREIEQAVEKNRQVREAIGVPEVVRAIVTNYGK